MAIEDPIEGQIVAVLGNREVIIDRGREHGVEIGMRFVILAEPQEVELPDSDLTITVEQAKTTVKVVRFEGDTASVAQTFRTIAGSPGLAALAQQSVFAPNPDRPETFSYDKEDRGIDPVDKTVRRGDAIRQVSGDEYFD
ncbi:hypothetical protein [Nocardia sp. CA-119907]|uniref:hypothetical protein n=1 Tax=Nocardia sp. CA-119907 TaxID=3239973 RepID=UPI003D9700D6